jgi:hypothetical protein
MLVRAIAPLLNHKLLLLIVWQTSRTLPHSQWMLAGRGLLWGLSKEKRVTRVVGRGGHAPRSVRRAFPAPEGSMA